MDKPRHMQHTTLPAPTTRSGLVWAGLLLYAGFVVYGSLVPLDFHALPLEEAWRRFKDIRFLELGVVSRADLLANFVLYIPLAYLAAAAWRTFSYRGGPGLAGSVVIFVFCLILAVGIEFTQLFFRPRTVSLNDLTAETLGSLGGLLVWRWFGHKARDLWRRARDKGVFAIRALLTLYLVAYVVLSLFPYDLLISARELQWKINGDLYGLLMAPAYCPPGGLCIGKLIAEVLAAAPIGLLVFDMHRHSRRRLTLAFAVGAVFGLLLEAAQFFLASGISQGLSLLTRGCGAMLGVLLGHLLARLSLPQLRRSPMLLPAVAVASLVYLPCVAWLAWARGGPRLPLELALHRLADVEFLPFYYHYYSSEPVALASLLYNAAIYLPLGVLLFFGHLRTWELWPQRRALLAGALALIVAAAIEFGKLFLAQLHPDPTNALIGFGAAWFGYLATYHFLPRMTNYLQPMLAATRGGSGPSGAAEPERGGATAQARTRPPALRSRLLWISAALLVLVVAVYFGPRFARQHAQALVPAHHTVACTPKARGSLPTMPQEPHGPLRVPLTVKEVAGVGATRHPTSAVIPLPFGKYYATTDFQLVDARGSAVPAQFEVLNRWWCKDNSLRHILVHFQPSVDPYTGTEDSGSTSYYLVNNPIHATVGSPLALSETEDEIAVTTGPLKFTVSKVAFNVLDEVWLDRNRDGRFSGHEKIISSHRRNGGVFVGRLPGDTQFDTERADVRVQVEEAGPMRVVIRADAVTKYHSPKKHTHGFAVRIYAYANKPFVKIDYQLQNSAKNKVYAWPLYFQELRMDFRMNLNQNPVVRIGTGDGNVFTRNLRDGLYVAQKMHDRFSIHGTGGRHIRGGSQADGFIDVSDATTGVTAVTRYFWQMWPNGLAVDDANRLSIQLFPPWSAQWQQRRPAGRAPGFSETGLYWLQDMQHVYKEVTLYFHSGSVTDAQLVNFARTTHFHPVVALPTEWYRDTAATLDMGGLIPPHAAQPGRRHAWHRASRPRTPHYPQRAFSPKKPTYRFGWNQFVIGTRKWGASMAGGWPTSAADFILSRDPADYYHAEQAAIGELNIRPQWMARYDFERDWPELQLTENPYAGLSWRHMEAGDHARYSDAPPLKGTGPDAKPRDDEHGWFYHVEEAYYFTGNPWIRDWYEFIGEFRKTKLNQLDPVPDPTTRAVAHSLANALQAYRVTGDTTIIDMFYTHLKTWLREDQSPVHGGRRGTLKGRDSASHVGYLSRTVISYMEEMRGGNWQAYAEAFNLLSGMMEWNFNHSNFSGYIDAYKGEIGSSSRSGWNMADPQAWYYWHTGKRAYLDHLLDYLDGGIGGGPGPYERLHRGWRGGFQGRWVEYVTSNDKPDPGPPPPITDLKISKLGPEIHLRWTAPEDAFRYHVVYADRPISETTTDAPELVNWWAAHAVGPDLRAAPGSQQNLTVRPDHIGSLCAAIFSFDRYDNMSDMSNVACLH